MAEEKYYGIYQGIITSIKDPEKRGRIKIKCPEVFSDDETISAWCDPCVNVAYDNGGDFCVPSVDETVWVMFIAGDVNRPVWLGGWWQEKMSPLGKDYSKIDDVRIINYSDCTIVMKKGTITINVGSGTGDLVIEDNKVTVRGDLVVNGKITASNDIVASNSVSVLNHTHTSSTAGTNTSKPN